jgi:amino acid transporter
MSAIGATVHAINQVRNAGRNVPRWTVSAEEYAAIERELVASGFPIIVFVPGAGCVTWDEDNGTPPHIMLQNVPVFSMESLAS